MTMMIFRKNRSCQAALAMAKYTIDDDYNDIVEDPVDVEKHQPETPAFATTRKVLKKMVPVSSIMSKLFFNKKQQTQEHTIALAKFTIDDEDDESDTDTEDHDEPEIEFVKSDVSVAESEDDIMTPTVHSYSGDDYDETRTATPVSHDNTILHAEKRQRTGYYVGPTYNHQVPPETMFGSSACFSATQKQPIHTMQNVICQPVEL